MAKSVYTPPPPPRPLGVPPAATAAAAATAASAAAKPRLDAPITDPATQKASDEKLQQIIADHRAGKKIDLGTGSFTNGKGPTFYPKDSRYIPSVVEVQAQTGASAKDAARIAYEYQTSGLYEPAGGWLGSKGDWNLEEYQKQIAAEVAAGKRASATAARDDFQWKYPEGSTPGTVVPRFKKRADGTWKITSYTLLTPTNQYGFGARGSGATKEELAHYMLSFGVGQQGLEDFAHAAGAPSWQQFDYGKWQQDVAFGNSKPEDFKGTYEIWGGGGEPMLYKGGQEVGPTYYTPGSSFYNWNRQRIADGLPVVSSHYGEAPEGYYDPVGSMVIYGQGSGTPQVPGTMTSEDWKARLGKGGSGGNNRQPAPVPGGFAGAINGEKTAQQLVTEYAQQNNPLMVQARTRAAQASNARGLLNSSMATQAGEEAALSVVLPTASQDADNIAQKVRLGMQLSSQEKIAFAEMAAQKDRLGMQLSSQERLAMLDNQTRLQMQNNEFEFQGGQAGLDRGLQAQLAQWNLSSSDRNAAASMLTNMESLYNRSVESINANVNLSATDRAAQLASAKNLRDTQLDFVQQLYGISLDWGQAA